MRALRAHGPGGPVDLRVDELEDLAPREDRVLIEVRYAGTVPDTFKDRAEVVVKGTMAGDQFKATEISAKCPSKYQSRVDGPAQTMCTKGDKNVEATN